MATYKPRLSAPSKSNNYFYKDNIFYQCGYGMPNCTCYAFGRWYELLGTKPKLCTQNAENWFNYNDGYSRGQTPKVGAVICWRKGKANYSADGAGHVAVVEQVNADGSIVTSNSNWKGTNFYTKTFKPPYSLGGTYVFQGFIYLPIVFDTETASGFFPAKGYFTFGDTHPNIGKVAQFMRNVFPAYTSKAALGNYYGVNIQASIKEFQRRTGLEQDGNLGPLTLAELKRYGFRE